MYGDIMIVFLSFLCVFLRSILNVIDRLVLRNLNNPFIESMFLNSLFPFFFAVMFSWFRKIDLFEHNNCTIIFSFNTFINGVLGYITAYAFCQGFRQMPVSSVIISSKLADLGIPLVIFFIDGLFELKIYLFSVLCFCSFIPIISSVKNINIKTMTSIIACLILTAVYAYISKYRHDHFDDFVVFFTGLSFWRFLTSLLIFVGKHIRSPTKKLFNKITISILFFRGFVAFISQAVFYYVISAKNYNVLTAWPIFNSSPLFASILAHFIVSEHVDKKFLFSMVLFILTIGFWIILS
jgi:hypothetical protein